jgi:hypothetical protein
MQLFDGLKEYQYSMPWPDRRNVKVQLQGRDLALAVRTAKAAKIFILPQV